MGEQINEDLALMLRKLHLQGFTVALTFWGGLCQAEWCPKYHVREDPETGESLGLGSAELEAPEIHLCHQGPQASMNQDKGQGHKV